MTAVKVQTQLAECPAHGRVTATRTVPSAGFPYLVFAVRRAIAARRPYRCPDCGAVAKKAA